MTDRNLGNRRHYNLLLLPPRAGIAFLTIIKALIMIQFCVEQQGCSGAACTRVTLADPNMQVQTLGTTLCIQQHYTV